MVNLVMDAGARVVRRGAMFGIAVAIGVIGVMPRPAWAVDDRVAQSCTNDYFAYCKQHSPESSEVRYCMEAHRHQLSKQCVKALIDAGEVPRKYLTDAGDRRK